MKTDFTGVIFEIIKIVHLKITTSSKRYFTQGQIENRL